MAGGKKNYSWIKTEIGAWVNETGHTVLELKESEELQIQYHPEHRPLRYHENACKAIIPSLHGTPAGDIYNAINSSVDGRTLNTHVSPYFTSEAYYARQRLLQQQHQQRQQQAPPLQPQQNDYYSGITPPRSNVNGSELSPHYVQQQQYPSNDQFGQFQNNNSPDLMSLASTHTQQSTAAMSLASGYNQMGSSMNHDLQRSVVPQPSPHHEQQQYRRQHDQFGQLQNNNSPDLMSLASTHTQQSTAAMSLASGYNQTGAASMNHDLQRSPVPYVRPRHQGGNDCYSPVPTSRRNKTFQKKLPHTVSPKKRDVNSSANKMRQLASGNSRKAREEQQRARRQQLSQPANIFGAPSSGGNQPYENIQQLSQPTNLFGAPSSSINQSYESVDAGALLLLAHLDTHFGGCELSEFQVGELRNDFFHKVDVSRGMLSEMEFETLDDLWS